MRNSRRLVLLSCLAVVSSSLGGLPATASVAGSLLDDFANPTERDLDARERSHLEDLVEALKDADPTRRREAQWRLVAIGPAAVGVLRDRLESTSYSLLISRASLALAAIGDPGGVGLLEHRFVEGSTDVDELRATMLALKLDGSAWEAERAEALRRVLKGTSMSEVRRLASLIGSSTNLVGYESLALDALARERQHPVRAAHLIGLAERRTPKAAETLAKILRTEDNGLERRAALYAAARLAEPSLAPALERFRPKDARERQAFALALGNVPDDWALDTLRDLLGRSHEPAAAYALAHRDDAGARTLLAECIEGRFDSSDSVAIRVAACRAATEHTPGQEVTAALHDALAKGPADVRVAAALTLAWHEDASAALVARSMLAEQRIADPLSLEAFTLLCLGHYPIAEVLESVPSKRRTGRTADPQFAELCELATGVASGVRDPRFLAARRDDRLRESRAHYLLQRDQLRERLVVELLDLEVLEQLLDSDSLHDRGVKDGSGESGDSGDGGDSSSGAGDGSTGSDSGPPDGGDEGSGGGSTDGSGGAEGGDGSGGDDSGGAEDPPGESPRTGGDGAGNPLSGLRSGRDRRPEQNGFEADLLYWLRDHPLFPVQDPFAEH